MKVSSYFSISKYCITEINIGLSVLAYMLSICSLGYYSNSHFCKKTLHLGTTQIHISAKKPSVLGYYSNSHFCKKKQIHISAKNSALL